MTQRKIKTPSIGEDLVAIRAYERWMGRGCPQSDGADDWFAARRELEAERAAPKRERSVARKAAAKILRARD